MEKVDTYNTQLASCILTVIFFFIGYKKCSDKDFLLENDCSCLAHDGNEEDDAASSGYSTISNDNLPSPALYLPPPSGEGGEDVVYSDELNQREGGVSGWDDWRIPDSEVTLGSVISTSEIETVYR